MNRKRSRAGHIGAPNLPVSGKDLFMQLACRGSLLATATEEEHGEQIITADHPSGHRVDGWRDE